MDGRSNEVTLKQPEEVLRAIEKLGNAGELTDAHVWVTMWTSVANCWNCERDSSATRWADAGLKAFRERFRNNQLRP